MDDPSTISYITAAQMRMGIFYWVTVLWRLFPENATGFFTTNCLLISSAVCLTYASCYKLTDSKQISFITALLALTSPALFEVIYTLDKQENYFPFLFSAVFFLHLLTLKCRRVLLPVLAILSALLSSACYLSKETGIILCIFSALFFAANLLWTEKKRTVVIIRQGVMLLCTVSPLLIFKYFVFPIIQDKYVVLTFDVPKLLTKTWQYMLVVPDFFCLLLFTTLGGTVLLFKIKTIKNSEAFAAGAALLGSSIAATAALISFDTFAGVLLYIWLPIYFILLPACAYVASELTSVFPKNGLRAIRTCSAIFALLMLTQAPARFLQAQFQFSFDSMTSELAKKLAALTLQHPDVSTVAAMPTYSVGETELPEQVETLVRSQLTERYYETKSEKIAGQKFTMLNYLSPDCTNVRDPKDPPGVYRLAQFRGRALSYRNECANDYVGWTGFQILNGATPFQDWIKRPFGLGNLLVVPYGEATPSKILYRGAGSFAHPWSVKILNFPQLELEDLGSVERKLTYIGHHRQTIGWRILRVVKAEPVSFETSSDGWLKDHGKIFCKQVVGKPVLQLLSKQPSAPAFLTSDNKSSNDIVLPDIDREGTTIGITVPQKNLTSTIDLQALDSNQRFHIDQAKYTDSKAPIRTPPYLTTTADGWLLQNGLVIYDSKQDGRTLTINTEEKSAPLQITDLTGNRAVALSKGALKLRLTNGKRLPNGLFYLQLSSPKPITSPEEKRALLIQCKNFTLD